MKHLLAVVLGLSFCTQMFADPVTKESASKIKFYQIRNVKFDSLLRPRNASADNGTPVVLYPAQPWKCMTWKFHPSGESAFQLQNVFTSKTFAAGTGDSPARLLQRPFARDGAQNVTWQFKKLDDGYYQITDAKTGLALTAENSGDSVVLSSWSDKPEQKWELIETDPSKLTM